MYVLVTLRCFRKLSHNIQCNKVEWLRCWEKLQFTPMAVLGVFFCAALPCTYDMVDVGGHVDKKKLRRCVIFVRYWPGFSAIGV